MGNLSRNILQRYFGHIDILLLGSAVLITLAGLVTMQAYGDANSFFEKQVIWLSISVAVFFVCSFIDFRFLRRTNIVTILFGITVLLLLLVFVFGDVVKGAQSRFNFGGFAVQPAEYAKLVIIALLAKYFTRRHIEIAHIRHILLSGVYALIQY